MNIYSTNSTESTSNMSIAMSSFFKLCTKDALETNLLYQKTNEKLISTFIIITVPPSFCIS